MDMIRLFGSFSMGVISHVLFYRPTEKFGQEWGTLMRYAVGSLGMIPAKFLILHSCEKERRMKFLLSADLLALLTFGGGVLIGRLLDRD